MSIDAAESRFCPICGHTTALQTCLQDNVPTVPGGLVERDVPLETAGPVGGRWSLVTRLGAGGMADVYEARDMASGEHVAVKLLRPALSREPRALQRFYREAAILGRLEGNAFPRMHALGFDDTRGSAYLVMTLVRGKRLTELCPLPWREAARICAAVARALALAHERGIIHRDLKPDNVLVAGRDGAWDVTVMDFGVARRLDEDDPTLTETGAPVGTPSCMAPEQIEGREVDARTDLYALGCLLHRSLTGQRLFETDSAEAMLRHHLVTPPAPLVAASMSGNAPWSALQALRDCLVAKTQAERPSSAAWAADALERIAGGEALPQLARHDSVLHEPTHPGVPQSTTTESSGLETRTRARGKRRTALVGLSVLLSVVVASAIYMVLKSPTTAPQPELRAGALSALPIPAPPAPIVSTVDDSSRKETVAPLPTPATSEPVPVTKRVTIVAEPAATVHRGSTRLGRTPLEVDVPAGPAVEVWLRREGHERKRLVLDASSPARIMVPLSRAPANEAEAEPRPAAPKPWSPQPF